MPEKKILVPLNMGGQPVKNAGDASAPSDLVTLAQLDARIRGLKWKTSVKVATTAAITLSGTQTIDGVAVSVGDRVLVKNQADPATNGVYQVASGAWTRVTDFDDNVEVTSGAAIPIEQGSTNGDSVQILTTDGNITVGTTGLAFTRLGGAGISYTAGNGLQLSGSTFSVLAKASGGLVVDSSGVAIDVTQLATLGIARKLSGAIPAGSTSVPITHNFNTNDVVATIIEVSTGLEVEVENVVTSANVMTFGFGTAPTSGQYRYVIIG